MAPSRQSNQRTSEMLNALATVLDQVDGPLTLVPIPGLAVAAKSLSMLIKMVQKTKSNTAECLQLLGRLNGLIDILMSITNAFATATQTEAKPSTSSQRVTAKERASKDLLDRVDRLLNDVNKILSEAQGLSRGTSLQRFFRSPEDEATLRSLNEQVQQAQSQFQLEGNVSIETNMNELVTTLETSQLERDLASIRTVDAGYKAFFNEHKSHWLEGTRTGLLKDIDKWSRGNAEDATARIFVLAGGAGTGKSTIAVQVAKTLDEAGVLGGSFFFDRGVAGSSAGVIFPTLAVQIARRHLELAALVVEGIKKHKVGGDVQRLSYALDQLIIEPLSNVPDEDFPTRPIVFVVDAIDECIEQDQVPEMLYLLLDRLCNLSFPLRLFLTTRPEYHIEDAFVSAQWQDGPKPFRLQNIPPEIVHNDIRRFLQTRLIEAGIADTLKTIRDDVIEALADAAGGHFIYASTCVAFLSRYKRRPGEWLEKVLSGALKHTRLDDLYRVVIVNAFTMNDIEYLPSTPMILGALGVLQDQLTPECLRLLLHIKAPELYEILDRLQSVLTFSSNQPIRLLHASFPQYLIDPNRCQLPNISDHPSFRGNSCLSLHCLDTLLNGDNLKRNICNLPDPLILTNEIPDLNDRLARSILPHVQYASLHWAFHLCNSESTPTGTPDSEMMGRLNTFVETKMLHWMEVLGMIGRIDRAVSMLSHVLNWYKADDNTRTLLKEGYRFVLTFRDAIKACPFQVYVSGLGFAPSRSLLRSLYAPQVDMLNVLGELDETWGACLRVMEGHDPESSIHHVSFSRDGRWIASSSSDSTINIWDADSGFLLRTLSGHTDDVRAHGFSLDDTIIFSVSSDKTIRSWNPISGAPLKVIKCRLDIHDFVPLPTAAVTDVYQTFAVVFCQSRKALSGIPEFGAGVLRNDGQMFKQLCKNATSHLDWSLDGKLLAVACEDATIPIFETTSYSVNMRLFGHSGAVLDVKFVPQSDLLVSSSEDKTLRLWRLDTSTCIHVFEGYPDCIAVNLRNSLIASVSSFSSSNSIRLCSITTPDKSCTAIYVRPESLIETIDVSPRGDRLVTGHGHTGLVRLWDVEDRPPPINASVPGVHILSPDGRFLAYQCYGETAYEPVIIWSLQDNLQVATIQRPYAYLEQIAVSTNGTWVVSRWSNPVGISLTNLERETPWCIYILGQDPYGKWVMSAARSRYGCSYIPEGFLHGVGSWGLCGVSDDGRYIYLQDIQTQQDTLGSTSWLLIDWHSQEVEVVEENEVPPEYLKQNSLWQRYTEDNAGWLVDRREKRSLCWIPPNYRRRTTHSSCVHADTQSVKYFSVSRCRRVIVLDPHPRHGGSRTDGWRTLRDAIENAQIMLTNATSDDLSSSP